MRGDKSIQLEVELRKFRAKIDFGKTLGETSSPLRIKTTICDRKRLSTIVERCDHEAVTLRTMTGPSSASPSLLSPSRAKVRREEGD